MSLDEWLRSGKRRRRSQGIPSANNAPIAMSAMVIDDTPGPSPRGIGPANWVDPVTYRRIVKNARRRPTRKRTTTRRRSRRDPAPLHVYQDLGTQAGRIIGRGDYWTDIKNFGRNVYSGLKSAVPSGTFANVGTAVGGAYGQPALGTAAGNLFSKLVGFGDYAISGNSIMGKMPMGVGVPHFGSMSDGVRVQHREYVTDVTVPSSTAFTSTTFRLNPAQASTFPWLSFVAENFQQYQLIGCVFEYKSLSSEYVSTQAMGSIIMATDYDSADQPFPSKQAMENSQFAVSGKPSCDLLHPIECAPNATSIPILYNNSVGVPSGKDIRLYDMGAFQFATSGVTGTAGTVLGELWVTYDLILYKPLQSASVSIAGYADHLTLTAPTTSAYFGTTFIKTSGSTLGGTFTANAYQFPNITATYQFTYIIQGTSSTLTNSMVASYGTGLAAYKIINSGNSNESLQTAGAAAQIQFFNAYLSVTAQANGVGPSLTFTAGTLPTAAIVVQSCTVVAMQATG